MDHALRRDGTMAIGLACLAMSLYKKVTLLLCALFATYGAIDFTVQQRVVLPSFEELEADLARTDMERVTRALDGELAQLLTFCGDLEVARFLELQAGARVTGNITYRQLRMDCGATVDGKLERITDAAADRSIATDNVVSLPRAAGGAAAAADRAD